MRIIHLPVFLFVLLGLGTSCLSAQQKMDVVSIDSIYGMAVGSESETIKTIMERAVNEARIKALREAGIHESIHSYSAFFQSETRQEYEELFASDILTDMRGAVKHVHVFDTKKTFTSDGMPRVEVWINCEVVKYTSKPDPAFVFEASGVKPVYQHNDRLEFSVRPHQNGYLRAFVFTGDEAFQVFPNEYEASFELAAGETAVFPKEAELILETDEESEMHRLLLVFLKQDIPYVQDVDYKEIFDWLFSIPPDQRALKTFSFSVTGG